MKTIIKHLILILFLSFSTILFSQTPPTLPSSGPGGSDAIVHADFDSAFYGNDQHDGFWLFEPADPKPDSAYIVVYWHGTAIIPKEKIGEAVVDFCAEVVKRGYTVVAPLYQWDSYQPGDANKISHVRTVTEAAFTELEKPGHVAPIHDDNGKVIYSAMGYSLGGGTVLLGTANLSSTEIIHPKSITCFAAASASGSNDYSGLPTDTKIALQVGVSDPYYSSTHTTYWPKLDYIPCENRILLTVNENSGVSEAGHLYHIMAQVDANDYYASWKYAVGMADCSMKGTNCEYVLTNRDSIAYMGKYSDGTPLVQMSIDSDECLPYSDTATYLTIDSLITLTPRSNTKDFTIETDGYWILSKQDTWYSISNSTGKDDFTITIDYDNNYSASSRQSLIIITSPEFVVDTILIYQPGGEIATDVSGITLAEAINSEVVINVSSNTVWGISSNEPWIQLSTSAGIENVAVTVSAKSTNTGSSRQGTITLFSSGLSSVVIDVVQTGANSIEGNSIQEAICYPNPAFDIITLSNIESFEILQVFNYTGKIINTHNINSHEITLDIHEFTPGDYILNLVSQSKKQQIPFTKI